MSYKTMINNTIKRYIQFSIPQTFCCHCPLNCCLTNSPYRHYWYAEADCTSPNCMVSTRIQTETSRKWNIITNKLTKIKYVSQHKKWSLVLRNSSLNVTKSAISYRLVHIYWRNLQWKTSVQWWKYQKSKNVS